jgi:hypothetical protein
MPTTLEEARKLGYVECKVIVELFPTTFSSLSALRAHSRRALHFC